jgi:hypothetical protein
MRLTKEVVTPRGCARLIDGEGAALGELGHATQEILPVFVGLEDLPAGNPSSDHVVERTRSIKPRAAWHTVPQNKWLRAVNNKLLLNQRPLGLY